MSDRFVAKETERFLTKEEELRCGERIQSMLQAQQKLQDTNLSLREQHELRAIVADGEQALEELTSANTALVWSRAKAFKRSYSGAPDIEDIAQEGMIGLMKAALKFDPKRGNKFSTVAYHWIKQSIVRGINSTSRTVRLPENRVSDLIQMNRIRHELSEEGLSDVEIREEIQKRLELSDEYYTSIVNASSTTLSLNQKIGDGEEDGRELIDYIGEANHEESAEHDYMTTTMYNMIVQEISNMSEIEQEVVTSYYKMDIGGTQHATPRAVKVEYDLSSAKYNRILNNALKTLRESMQLTGFSASDFE